MQLPLVAVAFGADTPDDLAFKKSIEGLYEVLAKRSSKKVRPFDAVSYTHLTLPTIYSV